MIETLYFCIPGELLWHPGGPSGHPHEAGDAEGTAGLRQIQRRRNSRAESAGRNADGSEVVCKLDTWSQCVNEILWIRDESSFLAEWIQQVSGSAADVCGSGIQFDPSRPLLVSSLCCWGWMLIRGGWWEGAIMAANYAGGMFMCGKHALRGVFTCERVWSQGD